LPRISLSPNQCPQPLSKGLRSRGWALKTIDFLGLLQLRKWQEETLQQVLGELSEASLAERQVEPGTGFQPGWRNLDIALMGHGIGFS